MSFDIDRGRVLAVVLGRGGSKGLPGKNLKLLGDAPLISWAIAVGSCARRVDRLICSSDDMDILDTARRFGAEVPFVRPAEYASDGATDLDVFGHALRWLGEHEGKIPELVVQLRPTTPFRDPAWIDSAVDTMLADSRITCMRSVTESPLTPYKMWVRGEGSKLEPLLYLPGVAEPFNMPRQALPKTLWHTGQLDVIRSEVILAGSMTGANIHAIDVPLSSAVDIDTALDFAVAQSLFDENMPIALRDWIARDR
ncbi:acylneuraminate cytidylyltransferase family protein [Sphingobium sp. Z007]|uniref:acylneuraminate cytidylyltransferase family protein n=1 Tax=Sphingobium sp. Z007 TaxID=627495 RepID=UPI000B498489|nr:acylneuraminate cytidylyltransferase family protein [Sphingobium sp. Z007]